MSLHTTTVPHEYQLTAMELVQSPRLVRRLARWLLIILGLSIIAMAFLPWQQTARGTGRVVAYSPTERPQTIESPIYGRIVGWGDNIVEGREVKKGEFILEIRDNDPERASRLELEVLASQEKLDLATLKATTYGQQVVDFTDAKEQLIRAYTELVEEAQNKLAAEKQGVLAAEAAVAQTESNYLRQKKLYEGGLYSGTSFEKDERSYREAQAKLKAAKEYVTAAENALQSKQADLKKNTLEAQTKISKAEAEQQAAQGEAAMARKELVQAQGKQAQFQTRSVVAPKDGVILRLMANENAEMLKEGDPLFTIVPKTTDRAVELWVDGNDVPLVTAGREVRLQFEGWPAIQFAAGWPKVAMGTFGGEVVAIDATDNGQGKFRVLIRPNTTDAWPEERFLRQGVRANGWILLNQVALGYELWRQLNGFPPVYGDEKSKDGKSTGGAGASEKESKKVKLPK
ncbi:MAG: HlyD family efflux transporter periplasmic adaptor subunit [Pirellulales bacterium]